MTRQIRYWAFVLRTYPRRELHKHSAPPLTYAFTLLLSIVRNTGLLEAAVDGSLQTVEIARFYYLPLACNRRRRPGVGKYARWA